MERRHLTAYTERNVAAYPAYFTVIQEEDGRFAIVARPRGQPNVGVSMVMAPEELRQCAREILAYLDREVPVPPAEPTYNPLT